ncbi:hypothetical protein FV230_26375, partial [Methylobacterium sp. WL6]
MTGLGVYVGNSPSDVDHFENWLGKPVDFVEMFLNQNSWAEFDSSIPWATSLWKNAIRDVHWSVPLTTWYDGNLDSAALGAYNDHYLKAAQAIADSSYGDGPIYIRTGWEMNGTWFPWSAQGHEQSYIGAWQQFVDTFRSVSDRFKFEWTPNVGNDWFQHPADAYPGDKYVDVIGMDFYWNNTWMGTDPAQVWDWMVNQSGGLQWQADFAAAHGKPIAYSEWGANSPDAALYFDKAAAWFAQHKALYQSYWNYGDDGYSSRLDTGLYPAADAAFIKDFGGPVGATTPSQVPLSTLVVNDTADHVVNAVEAKAVAFRVASLGLTETAVATFTDGTYVKTATIAANGLGAVDLSGFNGSVGSSLVVTGSDGTTRSVTGTTIVADTVAPLAKASLVHVAGDGIIDATEAQSATMPVTGTLSAALGAGDQVVVSLNGVDTLASVSGTSFTAAVATPIGAGTVTVSVVDAAGNAGAAASAAYMTAAPVTTLVVNDTTDHVVNAVEAKAVAFRVASLGLTETAVATFTDGTYVKTATIAANGLGAVDLSGFNGSVGSSLVVTGSDGTTRSVTGTTIVADTVAPLAKASLVHLAGDGIIDATEAQSATMPVTGTLSAALGAGDQVVVSLNGVDTLASVSGTSFTAAVATPIGAGTVTVSVVDAAGNAGAA